jgi:hypothetical protein
MFVPGVRDGTYTEALRGLAPGDRVITEDNGAAASKIRSML